MPEGVLELVNHFNGIVSFRANDGIPDTGNAKFHLGIFSFDLFQKIQHIFTHRDQLVRRSLTHLKLIVSHLKDKLLDSPLIHFHPRLHFWEKPTPNARLANRSNKRTRTSNQADRRGFLFRNHQHRQRLLGFKRPEPHRSIIRGRSKNLSSGSDRNISNLFRMPPERLNLSSIRQSPLTGDAVISTSNNTATRRRKRQDIHLGTRSNFPLNLPILNLSQFNLSILHPDSKKLPIRRCRETVDRLIFLDHLGLFFSIQIPNMKIVTNR